MWLFYIIEITDENFQKLLHCTWTVSNYVLCFTLIYCKDKLVDKTGRSTDIAKHTLVAEEHIQT